MIVVTVCSIHCGNCIKTEYYPFTLRPLQDVSDYLFNLLHFQKNIRTETEQHDHVNSTYVNRV